MHTKYSRKQVLSSEHDYQVKRFHKGDLSYYKKGRLTEIGRVFKSPIMEQHYENQHQNWIYFKNNIEERAEISVDNWLMKLHAYKNKYAFSEEYKRYERYLKWKHYNRNRPY
jgi:hypothetical protein